MNIIWFKDCSYQNKNLVGGKNASLGELYKLSKNLEFNIADGFALTIELYNEFIDQNNFLEKIKNELRDVNPNNIDQLNKTANNIKNLIQTGTFTPNQCNEILNSYTKLREQYNNILQVAVRSSAIAEDLPGASFAGQQDTYLNIETPKDLIESIIKCYASLFNARAISYRYTNKIDFSQVKMSVAIQKMVRSDIGSAGVAFSIDPETGYDKAVVINSAFGLGELVVSGGVKPDEIIIDKRTLMGRVEYPIIDKKLGNKKTKIIYDIMETQEIETTIQELNSYSLSEVQSIYLAKTVIQLEKSYQQLFEENIGIDTEWALDGLDNKMYIIQARPETIHSNDNTQTVKKYILDQQHKSLVLLEGVSVGEKISTGRITRLTNISQYHQFTEGDILVTEMTTPDWEPIMKKSSGIITDKGGRTCHAAIVARELGINAIVGTSNGSKILLDKSEVTMSCAEGETGRVYSGILPFKLEEYIVDITKTPPTKLMLNVGSPENAFSASLLPHRGVGLARLEFIINNDIKIHPLALLDYPDVSLETKNKIESELIKSNYIPKEYFIKKLARGVGKIASAFYPQPVIVRLSDFKSNEYKNLLGGEKYEPDEENPMLGWRGASRYYSKEYRKAFDLECQAIKFARDNMNMTNIIVMIPFCRTPEECQKVIDIMSNNGLVRGINGLKIYIMCEIPSNVIEADLFAPMIDGVSIGGNDLLQLTLGVDRDSEMITELSNHQNTSYRRMISTAIKTYKDNGVKVGFCGQQPSDSLEFAQFLINEGINSISVIPDSILKIYKSLSK
jgi:pyruvate, water dikinase